MPTVGSFHRKFWRSRANPPPAAGHDGRWQYPFVQGAVFGSLFGALQTLYERAWGWWLLARRLWAYDRTQVGALVPVLDMLESAHWTAAKDAVTVTAHAPGFHRDSTWIDYSRAMKRNRGQQENVYRHLKAVQTLQGDGGVTESDAHLLIELAYQANRTCQWTRKPARVIDHPVLHREGA